MPSTPAQAAAARAGRDLGDGDAARLAVAVAGDLPCRDYAWALMDPAACQVSVRLWADITRRAEPGYAAAAASLLAFAAWQGDDRPLARAALSRALDDDPGYSMAGLVSQMLDAGVPSSSARLAMSPAETVAAYYGDAACGEKR